MTEPPPSPLRRRRRRRRSPSRIFAFGQAQTTDKRLLVIILRGGMDGLVGAAADRRSELRQRARAACVAAQRRGRGARARRYVRAAPQAAEDARALRRAANCCRSTPARRPIASARTSMRRTCSKPAPPRRSRAREGWLNKALGALPRSRPEMGDGAFRASAAHPARADAGVDLVAVRTAGCRRRHDGAAAGALSKRAIRRSPTRCNRR